MITVAGHPPPQPVLSRLTLLWEILSPLLGELFTVVNPKYEVFEKGWYIVAFIKPVKRLARSLATEREIVLLVTNFDDQQPRVIEYAQQVLSAQHGRFDPIVLIAHGDKNGDEKLKQWGRQQSITVLPLHLDATQGLTAESVQRGLCVELFSRDIFDVVSPVVDDMHFYGRRDEALDFARTISSSRIRSCFGIRKVGKTSFISRVVRLVQQSNEGVTVFVDCSRDAVWQSSASQLLISIATAIEHASIASSRYATPRKSAASADLDTAGDVLLTSLEKSKFPVLVAFDELDYITPASPTASAGWSNEFVPFWRAFRAVYQETVRQGRSLSIIVSGVSSKWFTEESVRGVENAALHFVPEEYLGPFARSASIAMVRRLTKSTGMSFSDESIDMIASACADMPFWIRKACSFVHRSIDVARRPVEMQQSEVEELVDRFVSTEGQTFAEAAVRHLCRVYPELRPTLASCLAGEGIAESSKEIATLRRYGLVTADSGPPMLVGALVKAGVRSALVQAQCESSGLSSDPVPSVTNESWAEDLAVISKARNNLERRMRLLVVDAIRLHIKATKAVKSVKDAVNAALPTERTVKLSGKTIDETMDALLWTELQQVILKNWDALAPVFADRKLFEQHMEVINYRPDAHAKAFDLADFALMRKSIKWMQDKVSPE